MNIISNQFLKNVSCFIISTLIISVVSGAGLPAFAQSEALKSKYDQQKTEISSKIGNINQQIDSLSANLENVSARKNSLAEQVREMKLEIAKTEGLITDTKVAISALEEQISENQKRIDILQGDMRVLIREIQKQDKASPFEALISSKNIGEAISSAYNLSSIQEKADKINKSLESATRELDDNRKQQEETQKTLQNTQYLLNSKKDTLVTLLQETQGQEDKYQELLKASTEQKKVVEAQVLQVDADFRTAITRENEELERQRQIDAARNVDRGYNSTSGTTSEGAYGYETNGANCRFTEKGKLTAPAGYFIWPTTGYVSQNYGCPSSAGINHDAFDIANSSGTPIVSVAAGSVMKTGFHRGGFGNFIVIRHVLPSGQKVYSLYAHMLQESTVSGVVSQGQTIGYMGTTGDSTGTHLHFMLISDSIETSGNVGCNYGSSKCFDPATFLP